MKKLFVAVYTCLLLCSFCSCGNTKSNISDDEINALLQGRSHIITVTDYDTLPFYTDDKVTIDGFDYYRVEDEKYDEWNEWTNYVKSIYTDEAADIIINNKKIIDIDGKTYTNDGGKGDSLSKEYTYDIVSETEDTVTLLLKNTDNFSDEIIETEIFLENTSNGWRIRNY